MIMKNRITLYGILLLAGAFVFLFAGNNVFAQGNLLNLRHFTAPDSTRVVLDLAEPPVYETVRRDNTLTILLKRTKYGESVPKEIKLHKSSIETITITATEEGDIRVQIDMRPDADVSINIFTLKPFQSRPDRLVLDFELPEIVRHESRQREEAKVSAKDKRIIIIDPGHGGEDPGAIGARGTFEKDIVLAISQEIKRQLDRHVSFQAYLTRTGDYYVPFDKRLRIAREYGADLFISVHADASRNRKAKGSSVYALSIGGASSVAAEILAQSENMADIAGGDQKVMVTDASDPILINMYQTNTINVSKAFGAVVLGELKQIDELKFKTVQEAPFIVLRMPEIPSVLIETEFLSNAEGEKKLRQPAHRNIIAAAIAQSVVKFFASLPPDFEQDVFLYYTVKKGDTLTNIAARFGITLQTLLQNNNNLDVNAPLHVGRQLKIGTKKQFAGRINFSELTVSKQPKPEVKSVNVTPRYHTVERGDSLTKIAARFDVTVQALIAENKLRRDDPLHVGKRLKIPSAAGAAKQPATAKEVKKQTFYHTVKRGDTLAKIAGQYGITIKDILDSNNMKIKDPLYVGRRLKIESDAPTVREVSGQKQSSGKPRENQKITYKTYQVKKGDTIINIARKHGVPVSALLELNNMNLNDPLHVGRVLRIGPADAPSAGKLKRP